VEAQLTLLNTYTSSIGNCIQALPKHVQRLVGNIPFLATPMGWDTTEPKYVIAATEGSVLFGVGYLSWVIASSEEEILLTGGGPDDGDPLPMTSYRSEPKWGLLNGAIGTVVDIIFRQGENPKEGHLPTVVVVDLKHYRGPIWDKDNPTHVPIVTIQW
jgi:hypothetical protein